MEKLCRKRPSPLLKGRRNTWAAGIVYAIGSNNFIFDKSMPIHRTAEELSRPFGVAPSTAANKAGEIRRMISMTPFELEWQLPELVEQNPAVWMLSIDGFIVDARSLPLEIQQEAVRRGLIPYVPQPKTQEKQSKACETPNPAKKPVERAVPEEPEPPADFSDIYERFRTE